MKDLELVDKLVNTNYFLDKVILKDKEIDLTFKDSKVSCGKLQTVLNIIEDRVYEMYATYEWVHIVVKRNKT